jgi:lysophospholipase
MVTNIPAPMSFDRRIIPANANEAFWNAADGWPIRRIDFGASQISHQKPRGSLLFLTGRGDHYEKYLETLDYLASQNWNVTAIDWRGQGLSGRMLADTSVGHIDDFAVWVRDLGTFWDIWVHENPGPHVILAHSMGGHLAVRAAIEKKILPDAMMLTAPMLSIHSRGMPLFITEQVSKFMLLLGRGSRAAWKVSEKPLSPMNLRAKMLTHDKFRYEDEVAWWTIRPGAKLGPASWRWVERAIASIREIHAPGALESLQIPVFIAATTADQLVSTPQVIADAKRMPNAELLLFGEEAAHELLRETDAVRDKVLAGINTFLGRVFPKHG